MSLPSYAEISRAIGHSYCRGILPTGQRCYESHEGSLVNSNLHWGDRRPTRSGIRKFLHLQAMAIVQRIHDTEPKWARYYRAQKLVQTWADSLGLRFPAAITDEYRATLRAMVTGASILLTENEEREEALRWATIRSGSASSADEASPPGKSRSASSRTTAPAPATTSTARRSSTRARPE